MQHTKSYCPFLNLNVFIFKNGLGYSRQSSYQINIFRSQIEGSVTASGGFGGFSGSLKVDVSKLRQSSAVKSKFATNKVIFTSGGPDMPEPIGIKLLPIYKATDDSFFSKLYGSYKCDLKQRRTNIKKALRVYPKVKGVWGPQGTKLSFKSVIRIKLP